MVDGLSKSDWDRVCAVFDDLVDLDPPTRASRLRSLDLQPRLTREVVSLLAAAATPGLLDIQRAASSGDEDAGTGYSSLAPGAVIGPFVIDGLIGRGGAGEVYRAHRADGPFEQSVAIKLLRPEAADRIALFDRERRLLASLEHPGIARLIDGGLAPDGRAYMAMEYVDGTDIVSWCAERHADLETRLGLFVQVCEAVAYAHRRLVVHRDLKPSNIVIDGDGRARLLDFGVARLLEATAAAETGTSPMLTPEYAAPEQLENRPPTTAADVYGLGAVLFELLVGHGAWRFDDAPMPTVLRRLLHDDAPAPSRAAADAADPPIAARRVRGDLDAIVLKAMRRNPTERYESVEALADDLARRKASLPVKARGGAGFYLMRRFVRRHRWGVAATAAVGLAIVVGTAGIAWQARATAVERDIARAEAARSQAVNQSVMLMFRNASESGRGGSATAKELLASSASQLMRAINPADPGQAAVVQALSDLYIYIDDSAASEALIEQALAKGVGRDDPATLAQLRLQLAGPKAAAGKYVEARRLLAQAAPVWAADPARYRKQRLEALSDEASIRRQTGDRDGALKILQDTMPEAEAILDGRDLLTRYTNLALHLIEANRLDEADAMLARGQAAARRTGADRTSVALNLITYRGAIASRRRDQAAAERYFRQAADLRRELYGPSTALAMDLVNLGKVVMAQKRPDEGLALLNEAQAMAAQTLGPTALPTLMIGLSRVDGLCALGRPDEAEPILAAARPILSAAGANSVPAGMYARGWAFVRLKQGRKAEAKAELDRAEAIFKAQGPAGVAYLPDVATLRKMLTT